MNETTTTIGVVAHYNLLERLEPAGPGELYRARDTRHGRTVIVRLLPPATDDSDRTMLQEAQSLASLSHANAITLFGSGTHEGRAFVAFERITGRSLRAEMAGRPMNARRAVELAIQITDAVAEAHALGFLHTGLSPETIGITAKGHAKIPAFHLGTVIGFAEPSADGKLADYISPEEAAGTAADERSDVYSIGAVLYEMVTARRPMHRGASAPSTANPNVPHQLDAVALKAVAPNPDRRYQSAAELAAALRNVLPLLELPEIPTDVGVGGGGARFGRIVLLTLFILGGLAAIAWWIMRP
jgi:eukaryotic-like serine/threonine-protein kinase